MAQEPSGGEPVPPAAAKNSAMADRWTRQKRMTALQALRYTRFVTWMRRVLPVAVLAIFAIVLTYALYPRTPERISMSYRQVEGLSGDLTMKKPRLSGTDAKGNPYLITADSAIQEGKNSRKVTLETVDADLQYNGARWANASAGKGFIDLDAKWLNVSKGVSLYTDSGYELHTASAMADLDKNTITGRERVVGQGPMGSFVADSFHIDRNKQHVTLNGHVHMKMYPKKVKR